MTSVTPVKLSKSQRYYRAHRDELLEKSRLRRDFRRRNELRELEKTAVMNVYTNGEGTCRHCGQGDLDVLCLDHVNDDGYIHRNSSRHISGGSFYKWVIKNDYPPGFQVLCGSCNMKKEAVKRRTRAFHREACLKAISTDARVAPHDADKEC